MPRITMTTRSSMSVKPSSLASRCLSFETIGVFLLPQGEVVPGIAVAQPLLQPRTRDSIPHDGGAGRVRKKTLKVRVSAADSVPRGSGKHNTPIGRRPAG